MLAAIIGLVVVVLLVIFGPKRLPSLGRQLGHGMREFKESLSGDKDDEEPPVIRSKSSTSDA